MIANSKLCLTNVIYVTSKATKICTCRKKKRMFNKTLVAGNSNEVLPMLLTLPCRPEKFVGKT